MDGTHELRTLIANTKAWVDKQHNIIQTTGEIPELSPDHIQALKLLSISSEIPPPSDGINWVGLLMEHHQANPSDRGPVFKESAVAGLNSTQRWQCFVTIAGHPDPFPRRRDWERQGHSSMPSWAKKKEAKRYACRCAVQWLSSRDKPDAGTPAEDQKKKRKDTSPERSSSKDPSRDNNAASWWAATQSSSSVPVSKDHGDQFHDCAESSPPSYPATPKALGSSPDTIPSSPAGTSPMDLDELPITKQAVDWCNRFRVAIPKYVIAPSASGPGSGSHQLFDGYAEWAYYAPMGLPSKIGEVNGILSRRGCKERVAEEIIKVLRRVEEERTKKVERVLEN